MSMEAAWLESVFFKCHVRASLTICKGVRRCLELLLLGVAICGCVGLDGLHARFAGSRGGFTNTLVDGLRALPALGPADATKISLFSGLSEVQCLTTDYLYSLDKGVVEMSQEAIGALGLRRAELRLAAGESVWVSAAGLDAVVVNAALQVYGPIGHLRAESTGLVYDLSRNQRPLGFKLLVVVKSLFLVFSTSTLVAYTLRETQARMLRFAYLIKQRVEHSESYLQLVTTHLLDSVAFAPIMLGMLSFLFEFFHDQLLALLVLSLIWACELFAAVSVRSLATLTHLPHLVVLYLGFLHVYLFFYPFGFSYVALLTAASAIGHAMLYFWNNFEIPALSDGSVNSSHPRMFSLYSP